MHISIDLDSAYSFLVCHFPNSKFFSKVNRPLTNSSDTFTNLKFRKYKTKFTNICYDFFINWQTEREKNCFGPIRSLFTFLTEKNIHIIIIINFHPKITSQNIISDDMKKTIIAKKGFQGKICRFDENGRGKQNMHLYVM